MIVLVILMIAGIVMASIARRSGQLALSAAQTRQDVQLRWGQVSIQAAVLPQTEALLAQSNVAGRAPAAFAARSLNLGDTRFDLMLSDEQAKANVNLLQRRYGQIGLENRLISVQEGMGRNLALELRPQEIESASIISEPICYASFGQVFQTGDPSQLLATPLESEQPICRLTCWGSGQVNYRRAPVPVLRAVLAGILNEIQVREIVRLRDSSPSCSLEELFKALKLPLQKQALARNLLTEFSLCHSLWIVARGSTRDYYRLHVVQNADAANDTQYWTFDW